MGTCQPTSGALSSPDRWILSECCSGHGQPFYLCCGRLTVPCRMQVHILDDDAALYLAQDGVSVLCISSAALFGSNHLQTSTGTVLVQHLCGQLYAVTRRGQQQQQQPRQGCVDPCAQGQMPSCDVCRYRHTSYHKQTKNQWARDDPAFVVVLCLLMVPAASAYCVTWVLIMAAVAGSKLCCRFLDKATWQLGFPDAAR
jgi:hypothetical protein